jgi:RNA polymerase sigma-32 factor
MASHPVLPEPEQRSLAALARAGDRVARDRLAVSSLRLVVHVAHGYLGYGLPLADLVQEGSMGLMEAIARYEPDRGSKVSTYVCLWARAYILRYVMANWRLVSSATTKVGRRLFFQLRRERARLEAAGKPADRAALAAALDVDEADIVEYDARFSAESQLEHPAGIDGPPREHADAAPGPDVLAEQADLRRAVRLRVASVEDDLDEKERTILARRLLPADGEPETMQSVAHRHGVSRQRIEQIEKRLRARIKVRLADVAAAAA